MSARALRTSTILAGLLFLAYVFLIIAPREGIFGMDAWAYWSVNQPDVYAVPLSGFGSFPYSPPAALVADTCTATTSPPDCGCTGFGAQIMSIADGSDGSARNCQISVDEILANSVTGPSTRPDGCSMQTCTAADALSVGIVVDAVAATYPL